MCGEDLKVKVLRLATDRAGKSLANNSESFLFYSWLRTATDYHEVFRLGIRDQFESLLTSSKLHN